MSTRKSIQMLKRPKKVAARPTAQGAAEPDRPYVTMEDAIRRRRENPVAHWPMRGPQNRLEPECWPELRPRFSISKDAKVFTMGSCFARNIENHLQTLGFKVPCIDIISRQHERSAIAGPEMMNVYTPTAILQELCWAKQIRDRDDSVRESDVVPLLIEIAPGRYLDIHSRADPGVGFSVDAHMERRRLIYSINREAFDCELAIITLGLIETWWDQDSGQSIEFNPKLLRLARKDRFAFRRLNYRESYAAVAKSIDLLLANGRAKVMITTSPIPIGFTFTDDDVIVANTYSKSVLRTVAGEIAESYSGVDYFPSYESILLTKKESVWENDLVHVSAHFVGKVMNRVVKSYVDGVRGTGLYETALDFCGYVDNGQWDDARSLYPTLANADLSGPRAEINLALAIYAAREGLHAEGRQYLSAAIEQGSGTAHGAELYFIYARIAQSLGDAAAAENHREDALADIRDNMVWLRSTLVKMQRQGWDEEVAWLLRRAETVFEGNAPALNALASTHQERGDTAEFLRLRSIAALTVGDPTELWSLSRKLEEAGDIDGAIALLERAPSHISNPTLFRRLVSLLFRVRRRSDAERLIDQRLADWPEDAFALGLKAVHLANTGQTHAALEIGRRALQLGTDIAAVAPLVERLSGRRAVAQA